MAIADGSSLPLAMHAAGASPHEVTLVRETLSKRFVEERPSKLVGDRAYDSDPLDEALLAEGIEMITRAGATGRRLRLKKGNVYARDDSSWTSTRITNEALEEMNAPAYPEERVYKKVFADMWCETTPSLPKPFLVVSGRPEIFSGQSSKTVYYCQGMLESERGENRGRLINSTRQCRIAD